MPKVDHGFSTINSESDKKKMNKKRLIQIER